MVLNFNVPIQVEVCNKDVSKYVENEEEMVKNIDSSVNEVSENIADMIATDFFRKHIDIETIIVNDKGFYY